MPEQPTFDFLKLFIEQLFDESGFDSLDEVTRRQYVTLFRTEAERRLGLALLPRLNNEQAGQLVLLAEDATTTPENMNRFWHQAIPDFDAVAQKTIAAFAAEFKSQLASA